MTSIKSKIALMFAIGAMNALAVPAAHADGCYHSAAYSYGHSYPQSYAPTYTPPVYQPSYSHQVNRYQTYNHEDQPVYAPLPTVIPSTYVAPVEHPVAPAAYVDNASYVGVSFLPTSTAADLANFLQAYSANIASGPDANGIYKIRLSDKALPDSRMKEVVDSMRSQTAIVQAVQS